MAFTSDSGIITGIGRDETNDIWRVDVIAPLAYEDVLPEPARRYSINVYGDLSPGWLQALPHLEGLELVFHGHLRSEETSEAGSGLLINVAVLGMGLTPRSLLALRKRLDG